MENKYFTPEIEDIRVGYEAEVNWEYYRNSDGTKSSTLDGWKPVVFKGVDEAVRKYHELGMYRVPYLTKEQIEAEGWKILEDKSPFTGKPYKYRKIIGEKETGVFNEDHIYTIEFHGIDSGIIVHMEWESSWNRYNGNIYMGKCKDINTFRMICKLLNIE